MKVWKMNGAGNAFAIFDARSTAFVPSTDQVRQIAEDLKADQIIALERDVARDVFMRIWNADGSEVFACGNASRCVGKLLLAETGKDRVSIQTEADVLKAFAAEDGQITVDMGSPLMGWEDIPLSEKMDVRGVDVKVGPIDNPWLSRPAVVSMGNPHAVFFVKNIDDYDIPAIGPLVEWHPTFPEGVNVGFAQVIDRQNIRLRVWERGAGLTKACGTGACAALVCAARAKLTDRRANLILDGGTLIIDWQESDDRVYMTGPVQLEFETEI
ncbi:MULTISPECIES: diaminopimelate epimerase [unclassified Hyphomonas]|jgi:diaminopimelate epimerase|uniref:diaminopimelate epimerase n=2 Tax=Hyphomonas TaxID=85 RepID=UPI000C4A8CBC|nr:MULTISPECIES: diaminopimelate epimerase [unclassified Hyphomonas]MAA81503.1 diaminopimelate epimerase [Hyphomonas sp.]MAL43868.1 diaminopimelate epimerase [Hyphomonas sp.]MAX84259.1 diaminopimelate epimerase [Hyphomonas sp.]QSR20805.1 diaminopimelate epimerase [Hyphomonas sp. KY3]HAW55052.1 diaminopimelate epimerase [Hyphomonas sp.]|tara:strand:- start:269 stop:1078 length:810 start_codon:yes stop_codon:yes gene_type:complete